MLEAVAVKAVKIIAEVGEAVVQNADAKMSIGKELAHDIIRVLKDSPEGGLNKTAPHIEAIDTSPIDAAEAPPADDIQPSREGTQAQPIEEGKASLNVAEVQQAASSPFDIFLKEGIAPSEHVMIERISDTLQSMPEFQQANWEKLTVKERLDSLQSLENKLAVIEKRNPLPVSVEYLGKNTNGMCNGEWIKLSPERMASGNLTDTLHTYLHEQRHAYQIYNMNVRVVEPNATLVRLWNMNEAAGYQDGTPRWFEAKEVGLRRYYMQPQEADANVFAEHVLDHLAQRA